jgi:hypothetical protein
MTDSIVGSAEVQCGTVVKLSNSTAEGRTSRGQSAADEAASRTGRMPV